MLDIMTCAETNGLKNEQCLKMADEFSTKYCRTKRVEETVAEIERILAI